MTKRILVESVLVPHTAFEEASRRAAQYIDYVKEGGCEPACLAIVGESRTGKSRCSESILARYPRRRTDEGLSVPVLAITVPSKPTVKSLAESFLKKLGVPDWYRGTETQKSARLITFLEECGVLALVVDEFHHFYDKTSHKVQHNVADWLKNIVSESGVVLIACGLSSLLNVIEQNEQLAGRFGAPVFMPRFNWLDKAHRSEWMGILAGFDEALCNDFKLPQLCNLDMGFRVYCATGGLIGYLTNLLRQAVWNALDNGTNRIDLKDLDKAYRQAVFVLDKRKLSSDDVTPFHPDWNATPNAASLELAATIGKPIEAPPKKRAGRLSASGVLAA